MIPLGFMAAISAAGVAKLTIIEYTLHSRTRRAITCVYWEPKSRMTICSVIEAANCEAKRKKFQASKKPPLRRTAAVLSRSAPECEGAPEKILEASTKEANTRSDRGCPQPQRS